MQMEFSIEVFVSASRIAMNGLSQAAMRKKQRRNKAKYE